MLDKTNRYSIMVSVETKIMEAIGILSKCVLFSSVILHYVMIVTITFCTYIIDNNSKSLVISYDLFLLN